MGDIASAPRVLVVDDDREIARLLCELLKVNGFECETASDAASGRRAVAEGRYDLIILDIMMPGESGLEVCRKLRFETSVPILMLTAVSDLIDRVIGLELGADDYMTKPFEGRELLARCRALLRRVEPKKGIGVMRLGELSLDFSKQEVRDGRGRLIVLTMAEFHILRALAERPNVIMSRAWLDEAAGLASHSPRSRNLDVIVGRIRQKLEHHGAVPLIETIRGGGYVLGC